MKGWWKAIQSEPTEKVKDEETQFSLPFLQASSCSNQNCDVQEKKEERFSSKNKKPAQAKPGRN